MKECRAVYKGKKPEDDCIPYDYDSSGAPLGYECDGKGCGGWLCSNPKHYIKIDQGKKTLRFCRVCVETRNIAQSLLEKAGL